MAEEAEVLAEVEAVRAVYGDDCSVICEFPPHLSVHMRPRTADISFQQFVEAVIGIEAGPQYPDDAPCIKIIDSKGLDEQRQQHLITCVKAKAEELSSCFMLVALCEEAVEVLSNMNHPAGDCPLCLDPLFPEDKENATLPFMKLMSCFHCFHSECIVRWWQWLQTQNDADLSHDLDSSRNLQDHKGMDFSSQLSGSCPVCRQKFDSKDIEHVLSFMVTNPPPISDNGFTLDDWKVFLESAEESSRRQKFESLLEIQKEKGGLIEPQKIKAIVPGMFLPEPASLSTTSMPSDQVGSAVVNATSADMASESSAKPSMSTDTGTVRNADHPRKNRAHHQHYHRHQNNRRKERNTQSSCKWIQKENISRQ